MKNFLMYIWQLPQNILGLIFMVFLRDKKLILKQDNVSFYTAKNMKGGISLGMYVFLSHASMIKIPVYNHEYGHCLQSRKLGWFYIFPVGLCSLMAASMAQPCSVSCTYYRQWTEKWANKLGGIDGWCGQPTFNSGKIHVSQHYLNDIWAKLNL